ncbi:CYTOCHROME C OXIDASE DEFICIENT 1 [Hibiscus trionum]|uniref:CYTOCHROME C OXIDASE DEFICIENT 1 n=1 Tax=Hibiscus trionum TaxID=183268 RepID=A0A9W7IKT6_HIBTR|nr:CYTOCHROME C OXIDASE DEFICIENT 1 [Hibiscus trionum]
MPRKNVVTWNTMIRGYFLNGYFSKAISMFREMPGRDIFTYNIVISGLMHGRDVQGASEVFEGMACARFTDALGYFMEMPSKCCKTLNSILLGLIRNGLVKEAHAFLEKQPYRNVSFLWKKTPRSADSYILRLAGQ